MIVTILGLMLIVLGTALLMVTLCGMWAQAVEDDGASRLMPTLAEDVLDSDLQRVYRRALLVDRLVDDKFGSLSSPTGTKLGRRARRHLVRLQQERFGSYRRPAVESAGDRNDEPPIGEARVGLEEVASVIDEAVERLAIAPTSSPAEIAVWLEELAQQLKSTPTS